MVKFGFECGEWSDVRNGVKKFIDFQRMVNERKKFRMGGDCLNGADDGGAESVMMRC